LIKVIEKNIAKMAAGVNGKPMGVFAVISEYNSPLAAPIGYAIAAMMAGNSVVVVPPKECPYPVYMLYETMAPLLPDGVMNVIFDRKGKATKILTENEKLAGIVAVGRSDRFEDLMFSSSGDDLKIITEFKGMNPMVIFRPVSMQAAAELAVTSAFAYNGQRTDACSKVIITVDEQKQFIDHLLNAAKKMTVGDPAELNTFVGPLISKESMERFAEIVKNANANIIFGGKRISDETTDAGNYVMPAIFVGLPEDHQLNAIDHRLPILSVHIVNDISEAIEAANICEFGDSMGIISNDERIVELFIEEAGSDVVYVNGVSTVVGVAIRADVEEFMK
jgi:acyl-CoA reductase-like NAD-dependent aldehyde dehydrogenase